MGDQTAARAPVTPLTWIDHDIAPGRFWWRCERQYVHDHPTREWIATRTACFNTACEGNPSTEHQWRYFMLYVAHLRVSGEL